MLTVRPDAPCARVSERQRLAAQTVPLPATVCGRRPPRFRLLSSTPPPTAPPPLAFAPPRLHWLASIPAFPLEYP